MPADSPGASTGGTGQTPPAGRGQGHHDWRAFLRLRDGARRAAGRPAGSATCPTDEVWFVEPASPGRPHVLRLTPSAGRDARASETDAVVLCPGGYDRQLPVPGWDLPGVMAAGGVQALLKGHGVAAGRRAVVAGTGPFLLSVATGLAAAGVEVVSICEAGAPSAWLRRPAGVLGAPVQDHRGRRVRRCSAASPDPVPAADRDRPDPRGQGGRGVTSPGWTARAGRWPGPNEYLAVDLVGLGWGFTPSLELVLAASAETRLDVDGSLVARVDDRQRSSRPGVYVAGEATGVGGARLAVLEGELAGVDRSCRRGTAAGPTTDDPVAPGDPPGPRRSPGRCIAHTRCPPAGRRGSTTTRRSAAARR